MTDLADLDGSTLLLLQISDFVPHIRHDLLMSSQSGFLNVSLMMRSELGT